ncbi:MAG: DUF2442 domain-containing protein [Bacteroidota bacterium]
MFVSHIEHAEARRDHTLTLTFENGERRVLDFKPYLDTPVFAPLADFALFQQVKVVYGSLEWPGERDLAYDSLYAESVPLAEGVHD